jgi:RND superfamily putative drug exporter
MLGLTRFVLRHKLMVAVFWLLVLVAGVAASAKVSSRLSGQFAITGAASFKANTQIQHLYGNGGAGYPEVALVRLPPGTTAASQAGRAELSRAFAAVGRRPGLRVADYASTGDRAFLGSDGLSSYGLVFVPYTGQLSPPSLAPQIRSLMRPLLPTGSRVSVTGMNELINATQAKTGLGVLAETLIAGIIALTILAFVFGSLLALLPVLMAAVAIPASLLVVLGLTEITAVSIIVEYLAALIGLGVAIDYSLLLVTRWREELSHGRTSEEAVTAAMATAGRSVLFSGITVAAGLLSLLVLPVPALRSIGVGGMIVPVMSVLVTLTLLPVVLASVGKRVDWPRRAGRGGPSRVWAGWARLVVRHRWPAAIAAVIVLAALGAAALGINVGEPTAGSLGTATPAGQALLALEHAGVPAGVLDPIEVLVPARAGPARLAQQLSGVAGVRTAVAPAVSAWRRGGTALISVQPTSEPASAAGAATIGRVRSFTARVPGAQAGGPGPALLDENHAFYGRFPLLIGVLALVTILLLTRAFRSLLLPVKAVLLNLISVGATFGVIVLVWQRGFGSAAIWGLPATGAVTSWVPLIAFAFLYGLSMDYEVFIITRIREERDRTGSTTEGIVEGVSRTGRLVTCAALILFFAIAALSAAPETDTKVLATALGAGILLDATIVRALLVPALTALFGEWNWWLPGWARWLFRVPAEPAAGPAGRGTSQAPGPADPGARHGPGPDHSPSAGHGSAQASNPVNK